MIEGPNFYFGHNREGNIDSLSQLCSAASICLEIVPPLIEHDEYVSSSRIRELVRNGAVDRAAAMLTAPYRIRGMVTHGAARGASLGFPTANLDGIDTLIPGLGVYAGRAHVQQRLHWCAINVGPNPTFGEQISKVEVHMLDFEGSIYGQIIEVDFIARLRDICRFPSSQHLVEQLNRDIAATRQIARHFS
jgi:riboflavin kinase/FMN adenylyltransferase